jgi:homoserine dehydrogenase
MLAAEGFGPPQAVAAPLPAENDVARLALLGSGTVGQAVLERLHQWRSRGHDQGLRLVYAANTRLALHDSEGLCPVLTRSRLVEASSAASGCENGALLKALGSRGVRILIDATADRGVARFHPQLLRSGIHVATACKLASGTSLDLWRDICSACAEKGAGFGDRATVGAGLPLLRSIRELRAGGDRIHSIAGIMSGSLAWLFDRFDGSRPFSELVSEAREAGFTEPDPRDDLSGEDVRRKLLILARAAGFALDSHEVEVRSLVPEDLRAVPLDLLEAELRQIDAPLSILAGEARRKGKSLRFVARLENGRARVGIEAIAPSDPLAGGAGTDNRVAIWSDRYATQPLVIQGPGAGPEVTAAALLDDVLSLRAMALARSGPTG